MIRGGVRSGLLPLLACAVAVAPGCRFTNLLERARSQNDASQEPLPTDPVPQGPAEIPLDDGKDWIELKSGEWLRGELLRIRDDQLDFDSEELDEQSFDLEDVRQVRSPRSEVVVTNDNRVFAGHLVIDRDKVWVIGERTVQLGRGELLAAVTVEGTKTANLSGKLSLGTTARSGNTDQVDFNASADLLRETARSRFTARYNGLVSAVNDVETANNHRITSALDIYLTQRTFLTLPGLDLFRDRLQNIDLRVNPYAAIGYKIVDGDKQNWRVSVGPAYQFTRLQTVEAGESRTTETGAINFSTEYDWEVTKDIDLDFNYLITAPVPDPDLYNHNLILRFSIDLLADLDLDITFVWDRVNKPVTDSDGNTPVPNDFRTTIGIGWEF